VRFELADVAENPHEPVYSPFLNERGPAISLIHSCWSFTRELGALHGLYRKGLIADERRFFALERKFYRFFELALPVVHDDILLTEFGIALVAGMESAMNGLVQIGPRR
jgi:hypothetical protein